MRALWFVCLVACGGGSHPTSGDASGDGPPGGGDGPPAGTQLADRLQIHMIDAPGGVLAGTSSWRIWGTGSLNVAPVFVAGGHCESLVGYTATGPHAKVALINTTKRLDVLTTTLDLGPYVLRGLAREDDGQHFAALLWDGQQTLHVQRFDLSGTAGWSADLSDSLAAPTDFNIGESRLDYGNGRYGAYYHVHGVSGFAMGHEGDQLKWIDATSGAVSNGWSWGCSHSMSELLRTSGSKTLAACVTDCYPGTSGTNFATDSIGGVYLDNSRKVLDVDGGCNGSVAGELGGMAPGPSGWKLVFNAHQNAATNGQQSYSPSTMNQDIGFASIAADGTPGAVKWLTTTPGNENDASIAVWTGSPEQYLVGWNAGGMHQLARVAADGTLAEGPVTVKASWGERDDPFRTDDGGDVTWAWFDQAGATSFHFARIVIAGGYCDTL